MKRLSAHLGRVLVLILIMTALSPWAPAHELAYESELVFSMERMHNHASSIITLPNGELFAVWYRGSGEHEANDVKIMGARRNQRAKSWSKPFVLADTPDFPDANPVIFIDGQKRLQLIWSIIVGNDWRRSFLTRRLSLQYQGFIWPPVRQPSKPLHFELSRFAAVLHQKVKTYMRDNPGYADAERIVKINESSGSRFLSRLGWIARSRPLILPSGRILLPLYSDALSLSVMALSDDGGTTWFSSEPIVGLGSIQPTVVRKNDGTLVAYMRNAGPPPKRLYMSVSKDDGMTWSFAKLTNLPNPDSAAEIIRLENGLWAMAHNDTEAGRHRLAISISDDEGRSWRWTRHLERDTRARGAGQFHYPSIVQDKNNLLHVSYSYFLNHMSPEAPYKAIKHAVFNVEWVRRGASITGRN